MKREPVKSSNLKSVGYDKSKKLLEIEFHTGAVYQYMNVLEHIYKQLMRAPSLGVYFHKYIRDEYKYIKL